MSFISVALGEENADSLPASCSSLGRTNSKTPISQTLNPPKSQEFSFSLFFFLFKLIGFSLSCFFLFFFVLSPAWVGFFFFFVGFLFFPWLCRGSRPGQGLGLLLVGFLFIHLFHLHPPVLKPDFDLPLGEVENPGHLIPTVPG